jgi:hypothetical protein
VYITLLPSTIQEHPIPMNVSYDPPQSLLALTLELKESSEKRAKINLSRVLFKLLGTIFFQEAPALATLRDALGDVYTPLLPDGLENHELLYKFFTCVPFTTYEDYQPFFARLLDSKLPRLSDVNNLLSPGLPAYIARTSGTTGGQLKYFLKYPDSLYLGPRWDSPDVPGFKRCQFTFIHLNRWKTVVDDNDNIIQDIPVSISSSGRIRHSLGIGPMDDEKIIDKKGWRAKFLAGYVYET